MKLVYIQGGARLKRADDGSWFINADYTDDVWQRYLDICDELVIILRTDDETYPLHVCQAKFNKVIVRPNVKTIALPDIMKPASRFFSSKIRHKISKIVYNEVKDADRCILRSSSYYTIQGFKACRKYGVPYAVEVTGFIKESQQTKGFAGRLLAVYFESYMKKMTRHARGAIYVTNQALQSRYVCPNMVVGCSDVLLSDISDKVLQSRLLKIDQKINKIVIGTAGNLDWSLKGHKYVIQALSELKKKGYTDIEYQCIGVGTGAQIRENAAKYDVLEQVRVIGPLPHDKVYSWFDSIDIYVHPSEFEGLCRSIIEAMSRACPVIACDTGGNFELVENRYLVPVKDYFAIANKILLIINDMQRSAVRNFEIAKGFDKDVLDEKRKCFLKEFAHYDK